MLFPRQSVASSRRLSSRSKLVASAGRNRWFSSSYRTVRLGISPVLLRANTPTTISAFLVGSLLSSWGYYLIFASYRHQPLNSDASSDRQRNTASILATTPRRSVLVRITQTLKRWLDVVWVWYRATEIITRCLPLVVLVPASCLNEKLSDWTWSK